MKRLPIIFALTVAYFILFVAVCSGQQWSGILSSSRAIDWSKAGLPATLPDGETTTNPWTPPTRTQSGSTITPSGNASTDMSNINNAFASCPNGHYILLGPGTFQVNAFGLNIYGAQCTLRGSGPQSTIIQLTSSGQINLGLSSSGGSATVTGGLSAGSTSLTVTGNAPAVGDIVSLGQCDSSAGCSTPPPDNGGLWVCGDDPACMIETSGSGPYGHQVQNNYVTSVSGSGPWTVGLSSPLYMPNWSTANSPTLNWDDPTYYSVGVGLEDLTIFYNGFSSLPGGDLVTIQNCYGCWIKGVRFVGSGDNDTLNVSGSYHMLLQNNYFHTTIVSDGISRYSLLMTGTADSLVLNNIFEAGIPWAGQGANTGNVYAYNRGGDSLVTFLASTMYDHHAYSSFDLYEGNQVGNILHDDTWGTHNLDTDFRNYLSGWDPPYLGIPGSRAIAIDPYHRFMNAIGNAMGTTGQTTIYQSSGNSAVWRIDTGDALTGQSLMRWGNVSVVTQSTDTPANSGIRFVSSEVPSTLSPPNAGLENPVPGSTSLPASFYMTTTAHPSGGTGLSWWKVCKTWTTFPTSCATTQTQPFPIAGPDVTSGPYVNGFAYDSPAQIAFLNLPIDPAYQGSYAVISSSWSGGIETLNFNSGVLPNTAHLMGGFQLSGANSLCNPSGGELFMTNSSGTTVQYALTSNPGVPCTGTFKFPDVKQFDERVFQADSGGATAATPTFSPAAGTYTSAQSVTISCSTPSSTIYYTLDGSTPTTSSTVYSTAINIPVTTTVKALCTAAGYSNSSIGTALYTITGGGAGSVSISGNGVEISGTVGIQ